jgi:hypothetical protein
MQARVKGCIVDQLVFTAQEVCKERGCTRGCGNMFNVLAVKRGSDKSVRVTVDD